MSATYGPPTQPRIGPVRSPRGLVDVEVDQQWFALRPHDSWWRDLFDSEFVLGLVAIAGLVVAFCSLLLDGPVGTVVLVLGLLLILPVVLYVVLGYAAAAVGLVVSLVRLLTRGGRSRLARGATETIQSFGATELWHYPRQHVGPLGPVRLGLRARLHLGTPQGELVLSTARRHRTRLEAVAWALRSR